MNTRQSGSFWGFLFAFIGIIALAFGVLIWSGSQEKKVAPVDNVALPN